MKVTLNLARAGGCVAVLAVVLIAGWLLMPNMYEARCIVELKGLCQKLPVSASASPDRSGPVWMPCLMMQRYFDDFKSDRNMTSNVLSRVEAGLAHSSIDDIETSQLASAVGFVQIGDKHSSRFSIVVQSIHETLAADVVNASAIALQEYLAVRNKVRCDKAVAQIHEHVEKQRRKVGKLKQENEKERGKSSVSDEGLEKAISEAERELVRLMDEEARMRIRVAEHNMDIEIVSLAKPPLHRLGKVWPWRGGKGSKFIDTAALIH